MENYSKSVTSKIKITILFLGTTGAGPVYSYEMAKALYLSNRCQLQIIIAKNVTNIKSWDAFFKDKQDVSYHVVNTYSHSKLGVLLGFLRFDRMQKILYLIQSFKSTILYMPFRVVWAPYLNRKLKGSIRIISTLHDPHPHDGAQGLINQLSRRSYERSLTLSNDIILLNKKDVEFVKTKYQKPICVIPHASFSYYTIKNSTINYEHINYRIAFFGIISPYKGLDVLVSSFEKCETPNLELLIAGKGKIPDTLLKRIQANDRIELINRYIADEEFEALMKKIDFVVLPYKTATQSGVIPLAFAFGRTVIATNVGALSEQIPKGTGLIVDCNDEQLYRAIDGLYKKKEQIKYLSENAHKYAITELTWEKSANTLLNYIEA